ncbi:MAG: arginase family protein [Candidatus Nanoarchaeia archaeon]
MIYTIDRQLVGKVGVETAPDLILKESGLDSKNVKIDNNQQEAEKQIYEFCKHKKGIFVGGEHSISLPIVKALNPEVLIVFDAHADCMLPMKEAMHEEWLAKLLEEWKGEVYLIACRKIEEQEQVILDRYGVEVFQEGDWEAICDYVMEKARGKRTYISIDIDVLDPAYAPGVHYPEPLGLTSREFFYLLRRLLHLPQIIGMDLVEVVPSIDKRYDFRTCKLASRILVEVEKRFGSG